MNFLSGADVTANVLYSHFCNAKTFTISYLNAERWVAKRRGELAKRAGGHPLPQDARLSFRLFRIRPLNSTREPPARFYTARINSSQNRPEEINPSAAAPDGGASSKSKIGAASERGAPAACIVSPVDRFVQGS